MRNYFYLIVFIILSISCANSQISETTSTPEQDNPMNAGLAEMTVDGEAVGSDLELIKIGTSSGDKTCFEIRRPFGQDAVNYKISVSFEKGAMTDMDFRGYLELVELDGNSWGKVLHFDDEASMSGMFEDDFDVCVYNEARIEAEFELKIEEL